LYVNSRRTIAGDRTAFYHAAPNFPARRSKVGLPRIHPEPSLEGEACNGPSGKVTVDGTDSDGKPVHNEWTGKYDGKDYPVTGSSTEDTRSYRRVDAHTLLITRRATRLRLAVVQSYPPTARLARSPSPELIQRATSSRALRCTTSSRATRVCGEFDNRLKCLEHGGVRWQNI